MIPIHEYWSAIRKDPPRFMRKGEQAFKVLEEMRPDLAAKVCGTWYDPFYDDYMNENFINFVYENWQYQVDWDRGWISSASNRD